MARPRCFFVVDASVARAAGETEHPVSKACRDFLIALKDKGYGIVMNAAIWGEWQKHQSRFSSQWRSSMVAKKRLISMNATDIQELRAAVESFPFLDNERENVLKDIFLAELAIRKDSRVASNDVVVRQLFCKLSAEYRDLTKVAWVIPTEEMPHLLDWLQDGASLGGGAYCLG